MVVNPTAKDLYLAATADRK